MTQPISRRSGLAALGAAALSAAAVEPVRADPVPMRVGIIPISTTRRIMRPTNSAGSPPRNWWSAANDPRRRGGDPGDDGRFDRHRLLEFNEHRPSDRTKGLDIRMILADDHREQTARSGCDFQAQRRRSHTGKDLEGKVVAVNTLRDVMWMTVTAWITATGGDRSRFRSSSSVAGDGRRDQTEARRRGPDHRPFLTVALDDPGDRVALWPMSTVFPGGPMAFFTVSGATDANPSGRHARIRTRVQTRRGWVHGEPGQRAYFNLVAGFTGLNADLVRRMPTVPVQDVVVPASLPKLTALMQKTGLLDAPLDLRPKIFT